jgi:hypothetical protein
MSKPKFKNFKVMLNNETKIKELDAFLSEFVSLPELIIKSMERAFEDQDLKNVVSTFSKPLQEQFNGISEFIKTQIQNETAQNVEQVNKMVKMASALQMIATAKSIAQNLKAGFARLGINSIIKEIKKLLIFILTLLKAPDWVLGILLIIDQILNAIFGWDLPDTMPELLSLHERNFSNELAAHFNLLSSIAQLDKEK